MNGVNDIKRRYRRYLKAQGWKSPQVIEECIDSFLARLESKTDVSGIILDAEGMRSLLKEEFGGVEEE